VLAAQAAGRPVISVDTKKKELVGNYRNGGREWRPKGDPRRVRVHDFEDKQLGKVAPYGVYDVTADAAWVSERGRRLFAASETRAAGWGGLAAVSEITGIARSTIERGLQDLDLPPLPPGQVRRKGGGARRLSERDATLLQDLRRLVEPATLGDPVRPLLWVSKSLDKLAAGLAEMGHAVSANSVRKLLTELGYSRQANRKKLVKSLWRPSKAHGDLYSRRNRQLAQTCSHVANPNHRFATSRWPRTCRPVHGKEIRRPTKVPHRRALVDVADPLPRHRRSPVLAVDTNVLVSPPMRTHNFMGLPRLARAPTGATGRFVHHLVDHL
jgi:hypothetical protein